MVLRRDGDMALATDKLIPNETDVSITDESKTAAKRTVKTHSKDDEDFNMLCAILGLDVT